MILQIALNENDLLKLKILTKYTNAKNLSQCIRSMICAKYQFYNDNYPDEINKLKERMGDE